MWSHGLGKNGETDEKHEDCVEQGFQLARVKLDGNGEGDRKAPGLGNSNINV